MNEQQNHIVRSLVEAIRKNDRFLVATHIRPDGDAVGSVLGLTFMLRRLGKSADPYCQDPAPPSYEFLPGSQAIQRKLSRPDLYDVAVMVDCADSLRVGPALGEAIGEIPFLINIDHHVSNAPFGNISWVQSSASSTCEMLYDLSLNLPVVMDPEIASQLYTGLLTDTGSFRFSNTNQRVLQIAMELVAAGARPDYIAQEVYDSAPPQRLRLLAQSLSTVTFHSDNRLATAELTREMFAETSTSPVDSEGFINHLRSVKSVEIAMMFREETGGVVHVSMRSKGGADVATFAQRYHGGGHKRAAAFRIAGELNAIRMEFTREAARYLEMAEK